MSTRSEERGYYRGMCAAVTWLHAEASKMNDPKAKRLLNAAAMRLGENKPPPDGDSMPHLRGSTREEASASRGG